MTMLASLNDPFTRLLDKEQLNATESNSEAELVGVGMQLAVNKDHKVVVIDVLEGSPAKTAGIKPGDVLTEINGESIKELSLDQIVQQIRGVVGTKLRITVRREQAGAIELRQAPLSKTTPPSVVQIALTRAVIHIRAIATAEILRGNVGYIRLDNLNGKNAPTEMRQTLTRLSPCAKLILDLRNCRGEEGLAPAVEIAGLFVGDRPIVSVIDAEGYRTTTAGQKQKLYSKRLSVLINGGTSQYAEVIAAALHDDIGATIVGQRSYGLTLVQSTMKLRDGPGLKVPTGRWIAPNNQDILCRGINPDVEVPLTTRDYSEGTGPWWIDLKFQGRGLKATDGKDKQLNKALTTDAAMSLTSKKLIE